MALAREEVYKTTLKKNLHIGVFKDNHWRKYYFSINKGQRVYMTSEGKGREIIKFLSSFE